MEVSNTRRVTVQDSSQVGEARRTATGMAARLGLNETEVGKVAIIATELATNLLKHAPGGELVFNVRKFDGVALEILALDKGAGIANLRESMRDGHSTAGTPGGGLGAIGRLSSALDIYTTPQRGTAIWANLAIGAAEKPGTFIVGGLSIPVQGEEVCGDAWASHPMGSRISIMVADGLGHGPGAAEAAEKAVEIFRRNPTLTPKDAIEAIHLGLRNTRGAAVAVAMIDGAGEKLVFAGLGNISGVIISARGDHAMVSHNGTAGMNTVLRSIQEFTYSFPPGALAVFHSDGLATHWKLSSYPGLARSHPTLVSSVLYRDYTRVRDDVTVVTVRRAAG
jgi:anti-sigma regulatory factor (Ser/Thr protein kinase)